MEKDNIQNLLIETGRNIVREKGTEALTARKLAEASGCSVGAIYSQFSNMDNFIVVQNYMTLEALAKRLEDVPQTDDAFGDMNNFLGEFVDFVTDNKNLWHMLHSFHVRDNNQTLSYFYLRKVVRITGLINKLLLRIVPKMERPERILSARILWLTLFALSPFLTKEILDSFTKVNKKALCQLMLNTYIAGLTVLEKKE